MWHRTAEQNEADLRDCVDRGDAPGLIAFAGDEPAGWCLVGPAPAFGRFAGEAGEDEWAITCLLIAPGQRGRGIVGALIDAALEVAHEGGAGRVVALPRNWRPDDGDEGVQRLLAAFRSAGFVEESDPRSPFSMRRTLRP